MFFLVFGFYNVFTQYTPFYQWTLLPKSQMDEIIGEASGETALHHVIEMAGYQRNRSAEEYSDNFREGQYVLDKLNEYDIQGATIERFESRETWDGIKGELWEISPNKRKLADYDDVTLMLASGSTTTDVIAELVWVEEGTEKDFEGVEVNGKIVVTSGYVSQVHKQAVKNGAVGVVAFGSSRELKAPLAIPSRGIQGENVTFGFNLPPRDGYMLRNRLIRGEKIIVHAVVEAKTRKYDLQVPTCIIHGSNPEADEIILSAHIYEGYTKQGANDNISGSAVILEVARMLHDLYNEGRLPKPERSIRFVWVPEFSGTIPWVNTHKDVMEKTLCNINLDMVGINLKRNNSFMCLMRTTFGNPHYINDVMENYYRYVGETNRELISNRGWAKMANPIVAPSGTDAPFYYKIDQHYGASDHEVFNHWTVKVPGIMMITWPDLYYHTSEDLPNKLDPTQLKRSAIIAAAGAYTIASADENMAVSIGGEVFSNASKRIGYQLARAMDELGKVEADKFEANFKKVRGYLEATYLNEKATILSVGELAPESKMFNAYMETLTNSLSGVYNANLAVLEGHMKSIAEQHHLKPIKIKLTELEEKAKAIVPSVTEKVKKSDYGIERTIRDLPEETLEKYSYKKISRTSELTKLINGKNSVLDIKKMLDTQYKTESDIQHIINYLELLKLKELIRY